MSSRALHTPVLVALAAALLAIPCTAAAEEYFVPPDNSAVNQYTESFPTAGGERGDTEKGRTREASPARALGPENARKLNEQGSEGAAAAEVAAQTAPPEAASGGQQGKQESSEGERGSTGGPVGGGGSGGGSAGGAPSGSSWLDSVLSKAFGFGASGLLGVLVPLVLVAALLWALLVLAQNRRRATA